MNAYSYDLGMKKIVEAVEERGRPKVEAARTFGVGVSSVERYVAVARAGPVPAPNRSWTRPQRGS